MLRRRIAALALLTLVLGGACQVTTTVGVDARADGSGVVRVAVGLDRSAAAKVPNLARQLEVDDLKRAGWTITGPRRERDGRTWVRAAKPFRSPADARRVVAEISGSTGPFHDFTVHRRRSFLRTRTSFAGTVDLTGGLRAFGDPKLEQLGVDLGQLERQLGASLGRIFRIQVAARLSGSISSNAPVQVEGGAVWRPKLGERLRLEATGQSWNTATLAWSSVAALAGVALLAVLATRLARRRRAGPAPGSS